MLGLQPGVVQHEAVYLGARIGGRLRHRAREEAVRFQEYGRGESKGC